MYLDFKTTGWERIRFNNKEAFDKVSNFVRNNKGCGYNDFINELEENDYYFDNSMEYVNEPMSIEENFGECTIEIYDDNQPVNNLIIDNIGNSDL